MALGPLEVIVVGFPGNEFNGAILPELERLVEDQVISVVDGLLLTKESDGTVVLTELDQSGASDEIVRLADLVERIDALISEEDVEQLAAGLEPNSSAAILCFEHTWSKPLRDAIVDSGGSLVADFRVPGAVVDELLEELAQLNS